MPGERPLYVMIKPPAPLLPQLARYRTMFGIGERYDLDRLHSTFLRLGQATPASIRAACQALDGFGEAPFPVRFDWLRGNLLQSRRTQPGPGAFQRSLARHIARSGVAVLPKHFWLHLSLDYAAGPVQETQVPPIGWSVEEVLLIESVHGEGRHILHGRWPLRASQASLPF
jgi:RNA 2',3'-cyclic 3'-phosphodiesterase